MIKTGENQPSLNFSFKLKLIKKPNHWVSEGLYAKLNSGGNKYSYDRKQFSLKDLKDVMTDIFQDRK